MADEQKIDASKTDHAAHLASVVDEITSHSESASLFDWNLDENGAISKVFNYAFKFGGLDEVDGLIEDLNSLLLARGAQYILKPGAACQLNSDGEPEALMVYY